MKKIAVLGASGLLGSRLVPMLRQRGFEVVCLGRSLSSSVDIVVNYYDSQELRGALDKCSPNVIINLAALADVDLCEKKPHLAYLSNVRIPQNIAAWMGDISNCHTIHISTDQVYGNGGASSEDDVVILNHYAMSKYAGELALLNDNSTVLRTNFFGKSMLSDRASFSDWVFSGLKSGRKMNVFDDVYFSPLSIKTLLSSIVRLINRPVFGIYNLGSSDGFTKADFVFEFAKASGLSTKGLTRVSQHDAGLTTIRPADMRMLSSKLEKALDVTFPTLISEIQSIFEEYNDEK